MIKVISIVFFRILFIFSLLSSLIAWFHFSWISYDIRSSMGEQDIVAQCFYLNENSSFDEDHSSVKYVRIDSDEWVNVSLSLPFIDTFTHLRIDPTQSGDVIEIRSVQLKRPNHFTRFNLAPFLANSNHCTLDNGENESMLVQPQLNLTDVQFHYLFEPSLSAGSWFSCFILLAVILLVCGFLFFLNLDCLLLTSLFSLTIVGIRSLVHPFAKHLYVILTGGILLSFPVFARDQLISCNVIIAFIVGSVFFYFCLLISQWAKRLR